MICSNCSEEIPEGSSKCPNCGVSVRESSEEKKDARKVYTHFKVVMINPGPRASVIDDIMEVTKMPRKQVEGYLKELPWTIITRVPFPYAQETKILLERHKAIIKIVGMESWELDEEFEEEEEYKEESDSPTKKLSKQQQYKRLFLLSLGIIGAVIVYLLFSIDAGQKQGLVKFQQMQISEPTIEGSGRTAGQGISDSDEIVGAVSQHSILPFPFWDEGPDPFKKDLSLRFELKEETNLTIAIYDMNMIPVTVLVEGTLPPENYRVHWNGMSISNENVPTGVYIVQISVRGINHFHKIIWLSDM